MSTKHAILGVLMQCPSHGYQIKKLFAPFISKNGLNDGQVYPILTQLEKDELVQKEVVRQEKSPNKNIYHITERGREVFLQWLTGSEDETDPIKYDFFMQYRFLMKCNFFEHLSKEERVEKLRRQIETAKEKISEYERVREEMVERGLSNYKSKIVDFGIDTQMLKIRWAGSLLKEELGKPTRAVKARRNSKRAAPARNARKTTTKKG
ncbi:MAG: PadR family transcriptional regulator [Candidatus Abyssubacteria bacterium]|nr:PadR family transcriptional regulator [Candidatus Abyssubacteria bacterium]